MVTNLTGPHRPACPKCGHALTRYGREDHPNGPVAYFYCGGCRERFRGMVENGQVTGLSAAAAQNSEPESCRLFPRSDSATGI